MENSSSPVARDKTLRLSEIETGLEIRQYDGIVAEVWSVAFSPDGRRLIAGGLDGVLRFGATHLNKPLEGLAGHTERIWDRRRSPRIVDTRSRRASMGN